MFTGKQISEAMDILHKYKVKLFHACQFQDFVSYLKLGGIPSRQMLIDRKMTFTEFETDVSDSEKGLLDKVFLNIQDFGASYHDGGEAVPNPYGPILIEVSPTSSLYMSDFGVALRSAGEKSFNRETDCLSTIDEFKKLFIKYGDKYFVKFKKLLRQDFPNSGATSPEISCTFPGQLLSIDHFEKIIVDPMHFSSGETLKNYVDLVAKHLYTNLDFHIHERSSERQSEYLELCQGVQDGWRCLRDVINNTDVPEIKEWARVLASKPLDYQFKRFSKYLAQGTIDPISETIAEVA